MLDIFCRPEAAWVIEHGLALRIKISEFYQTLDAGLIFRSNFRGRI